MTTTLADMPSAAAGQDGAVARGKGPRAGQPKRRAFTAAYKARIVQEYDQLQTGRERGALRCWSYVVSGSMVVLGCV